MNFGAAAASLWCRAGRRSSCCSRMARSILLRTPFGAILPWSPTGNDVFQSVWLTVLSFEALLFTISIAFILLAMAKERTEHRHKTAALIDPLTGIANRRAFLQDGEADEAASAFAAHAVLLIHLDHFKSINYRFGHALGDRVLERSPQAAPVHPATDLFGRLGGEEFAAVLYDTSGTRRWRSAERIRTISRCHATRWRAGRLPALSDRPGDTTAACARRARHSGASRPGALLRQGTRAQPRRGCLARSRARPQGRRSPHLREFGRRNLGQIRGLRRAPEEREHVRPQSNGPRKSASARRGGTHCLCRAPQA